MENVNDYEDVNRNWENINANIQTSAEQSLGVPNASRINLGLMKNV